MKHIREHEVSGIRMPEPYARTLKHLAAPWTLGSTQLWVGMTKIDPGSRSNRHKHPDNEEVFYVVSGHGRITVGIEIDSIEPGSLILVPPGLEHVLFNDGDETLKVLSAVSPPFERSEFDVQHAVPVEDKPSSSEAGETPRARRLISRPMVPSSKFPPPGREGGSGHDSL